MRQLIVLLVCVSIALAHINRSANRNRSFRKLPSFSSLHLPELTLPPLPFPEPSPQPECGHVDGRDCMLFNLGRDMITQQDLGNLLTSPPDGYWLGIYKIEIKTLIPLNKCSYKWSSLGNGEYLRKLMCRARETLNCLDFTVTHTIVQDDCGRGMSFVELPTDTTETFVFHSQKPSQYMWADICLAAKGVCADEFFILLVPGDLQDQFDGELDLTGLPWDLIAADLKRVKGLDFSDTNVEFTWTGAETPPTRSISFTSWCVSVYHINQAPVTDIEDVTRNQIRKQNVRFRIL